MAAEGAGGDSKSELSRKRALLHLLNGPRSQMLQDSTTGAKLRLSLPDIDRLVQEGGLSISETVSALVEFERGRRRFHSLHQVLEALQKHALMIDHL